MTTLQTPTIDVADARRLTERIRLTAHTARESIEKLQNLMDEAKAGNAHIALGYSSWTAYLAEVLGEEPLRLAKDQRQELVGFLAGEGMSTRAIGRVVGASHMTVQNDLTGVKNLTPDEAEIVEAEIVEDPTTEPTEPETETEPPEPEPKLATVTGLDGKTYSRSKPKSKPGSYTDAASEAARAYRNAVDQLEDAKREKLGRDVELHDTETLRRSERNLGLAIRRGQDAGEIETVAEAKTRASRSRRDRDLVAVAKPKPTGYVGENEMRGIVQMTDGITDKQFETAIAEARKEGNLARANVLRKASGESTEIVTRTQRADRITELAKQGYSSRQMEKQLGIGQQGIAKICRDFGIDVPADKVIGKTRRHDPNRIARETVNALEGLAMAVELIDDYAGLDTEETAHWDASLTESLRALNRFHKEIRKAHQ